MMVSGINEPVRRQVLSTTQSFEVAHRSSTVPYYGISLAHSRSSSSSLSPGRLHLYQFLSANIRTKKALGGGHMLAS